MEAPARDPDEECIAVVRPGREKGMDHLFSITEGEGGAEFGYVSEMEECNFTEVVDMCGFDVGKSRGGGVGLTVRSGWHLPLR